MEHKTKELEKRKERENMAVERMNATDAIAPSTDIYEREDALVVTADMPGVDQNSVNIHVEKRVLNIEGHLASDVPEGYELDYGEYRPATNYRRSFTLSNDVNIDGIQATMKDGVLQIVLPKAQEARIKKIDVKTI